MCAWLGNYGTLFSLYSFILIPMDIQRNQRSLVKVIFTVSVRTVLRSRCFSADSGRDHFLAILEHA